MLYKAPKSNVETKISKAKKRKSIFFIITVVVSAIVFLVSVFFIVKILLDYKSARDEYQMIADFSPKVPPQSLSNEGSDDGSESIQRLAYETLKEMNDDYVAWIEIPGTNIDYPVVHYSNNEYYLTRTFLGSYNVSGAIFIDYRSGSDLTNPHVVIYGHRMNDGSMFSDLKEFLARDFLEENRYIHIYTETEKLTYEIFSARQVSVLDDIYTFQFDSTESYANWLSDMVTASGYSGDLPFDRGEQTITLSTCVYEQENNRNVLQAYLVSSEPIDPSTA